MSVSNPTAWELFTADSHAIDAKTIADMEDNFFFLLRLPNGTKKTTYRHRLVEIAEACNGLLAKKPTPFRLLDIGISSGVTTKEWMDTLDTFNANYHMDAVDLCLHGVIESIGPGFRVLRDSAGRALQFDVCGWALANHFGYGYWSCAKRLLPVSIARLFFGAGSWLATCSRHPRTLKVSLVTRGLTASNRLRLLEADVLRIGSLGETYDLIRAANILNRAYFSDSDLGFIIGQIGQCMKSGSLLIAVRTRDDRSANDGTVFQMENSGRLGILKRFGSGSEIESIVAAVNALKPST